MLCKTIYEWPEYLQKQRIYHCYIQEIIEDTKGIIRNKDRQHNGQNKWDKTAKNKNDLQNTTQKTTD